MTRMHAGVYFIPQEGTFYNDGSALVGFDIRSQKSISQPSFVHARDTADCAEYGFHLTITDAIEYDVAQIPELIDVIAAILSCLKSDNRYELTKAGVSFWRPGSNQAALRFDPNRNVELLHDVLVTALHPLGLGSEYTRNHAAGLGSGDMTPAQQAKIAQFYSPYVLDDFRPHFTCVNPYDGSATQRQLLEAELNDFFSYVQVITMPSICLVAKRAGMSHYEIIQEFSL